MEDKYKFRAKELSSGRWVYGSYMSIPEFTPYPVGEKEVKEKHLIFSEQFGDWGMPVEISITHVDPNTVGLCTGFKDKNGNLIYEGDIVDEVNNTGRDEEYTTLVEYKDTVFTLYPDDSFDYFIIGNKYDTPELIEEEY